MNEIISFPIIDEKLKFKLNINNINTSIVDFLKYIQMNDDGELNIDKQLIQTLLFVISELNKILIKGE